MTLPSKDQGRETGDERLRRLMRENPPAEEQMHAALDAFIHGRASLRVPVEHTDPDMVLSSAITELVALRAESRRLAALVEEARGYMHHRVACPHWFAPNVAKAQGKRCLCGFSEFLTRLTERA